MKPTGNVFCRIVLLALCLFLVQLHTARSAQALVNDSAVIVQSSTEVQNRRNSLIRFLWGSNGLPLGKMPTDVRRNVMSPVENLTGLERVHTLYIGMEFGMTGMSHLFLPRKKNNRLVIFHHGHSENCTFNDGNRLEPDLGLRRTINSLLKEGFTVLAVYMPRTTPEECRGGHAQMFSLATSGSPMKFFLEPALASLNYVKAKYPHFSDVSMIGFSGGGWTTTVYAAIDPRIKLSIPIAGTIPLYLRYDGYQHDLEQYLDAFYRIAGYPDLYVLGSAGSGRRQIQVLNRRDDLCFGERQHNTILAGQTFEAACRAYEVKIKSALRKVGSGAFRLQIDEQATSHMISNATIEHVVIAALRSRGIKQ